MTVWRNIVTGMKFEGTIPTVIEVPRHSNDPIPHTTVLIIKKGDDQYDDAVQHHMYLLGFAKEEDLEEGPASNEVIQPLVMAIQNYREGLIDADTLAEYAIAERLEALND